MNLKIRSIAVLAGLGMATAASAQSTWNMTAGCSQQASNSGNFGNSYVCTQDAGSAANATISAWSSGRDGTGQPKNTYSLSGSGWANAYVTNNGGSGWGVVNRNEANADANNNGIADGLSVGSPNHSVDSIPNSGIYDFVMVKFDTAQILSQFSIGWAAGDSDITVMRWTGNSAPTTTNGTVVGGGSAENLTSTIGNGGWQLVDSFANVCRDSMGNALTASSNTCSTTGSTQNTGATTGSSYWLIAAYNTTMDTTGLGWTTGNDGFKLNMLKTSAYSCPNGNPDAGGNCTPGGGGNAPEPTSLALAGLAAAFVMRQRRRARADA